jgi:predicted Ser/Thr protein kinase
MRSLRELKDDGFAHTRLVECDGARWVHKRFRFRFVWGRPLAPLARAFMRHELSMCRRLEGVEGAAWRSRSLDGDSFLREWVDGVDLRAWCAAGRAVPDDFCDRLRETLDVLHARGIAYNDLAKLDNVVVTPAGRPVLIDYQVSVAAYAGRSRVRSALSRFFLPRLQREDDRQFYKLKARVRPDLASEEERRKSRDRGGLSRAHHAFRRVFHPVKRVFYPKGSNETFRGLGRRRPAR